MAESSKQRSPAAFVTGIAWILLLVSGWAVVRLSLALVWRWQDQMIPEVAMHVVREQMLLSWMALHLGMAVFGCYASWALMRLRRWARSAWVVMLALAGAESLAGGIWFAAAGGAAAPQLLGVKLASGLALALLGVVALLLAWKLLRDRGIQSILS